MYENLAPLAADRACPLWVDCACACAWTESWASAKRVQETLVISAATGSTWDEADAPDH